MKTDWNHLEHFRQSPQGYESNPGDHFGWFVWLNGNTQIRAMATNGDETGWEHVSVTVAYRVGRKWKVRLPTWTEMCAIKRHFWNDEECVVQFHPAQSSYVNIHATCLHLWRSTKEAFPMPPEICV